MTLGPAPDRLRAIPLPRSIVSTISEAVTTRQAQSGRSGCAVAFTGGRDYRNKSHVWCILNLLAELDSIHVHVGDCPTGADLFVRQWCEAHLEAWASFTIHEARWNLLGSPAGPERNGRVVAQADLLVAFAGGRGTADCIRKAVARGIPIAHADP